MNKKLSTASVFQCFNWSVMEVTNHMSQNKYEHAHYSSHFTVFIHYNVHQWKAIGDGHTPWNKGIFLQEDGPSPESQSVKL